MNLEVIITALLGGGIVGGIVTLIQMFCKRKWDKADKKAIEDSKLDELSNNITQLNTKVSSLVSDVQHVKMAQKSILSDRIKWLGTEYLKAGEISFEDRRILHDLHGAYHNDCDGNGDFDSLMRDVDALPLKMD